MYNYGSCNILSKKIISYLKLSAFLTKLNISMILLQRYVKQRNKLARIKTHNTHIFNAYNPRHRGVIFFIYYLIKNRGYSCDFPSCNDRITT